MILPFLSVDLYTASAERWLFSSRHAGNINNEMLVDFRLVITLDEKFQPVFYWCRCAALQMQLATDIGSDDQFMLNFTDVVEFVC